MHGLFCYLLTTLHILLSTHESFHVRESIKENRSIEMIRFMLDDPREQSFCGNCESTTFLIERFHDHPLGTFYFRKQSTMGNTAASFSTQDLLFRAMHYVGVDKHAYRILLLWGPCRCLANFRHKNPKAHTYLGCCHADEAVMAHGIDEVPNNSLRSDTLHVAYRPSFAANDRFANLGWVLYDH